MTFADIVRDLRKYDEDPGAWEELSIYVADPQAPHSEAIVEWSMAKGGLPETAARRLLYYVAPVRQALALLGDDYDVLKAEGKITELCETLVRRVEEHNEALRASARSVHKKGNRNEE
jgi:hypothetical protein